MDTYSHAKSALDMIRRSGHLTLGIELPLDNDWSPEGEARRIADARRQGVADLSCYALGVGFGSSIPAVLTGSLSRKILMLAVMAGFVVAICLLILRRKLVALHGVFAPPGRNVG